MQLIQKVSVLKKSFTESKYGDRLAFTSMSEKNSDLI
jgi:hypothetical protein